jgi:serpin B
MKVSNLAMALAATAMFPVSATAHKTGAHSPATAQSNPYASINARLPADAQGVVTGVNAFSLALYKRTIAPGDNLFLSPASISTAMALAYRGARGKTAEELRGALHYGASPGTYFRASARVFATMSSSARGGVLKTANSIWVQDDMPLKPDYQLDVQREMKASLHRSNFKSNPDHSRQNINAWVANSTNNRITDLLAPGDLNNATRAVLVNAIYWKGRWDWPFDKSKTQIKSFTRLDGTNQPTWLMQKRSYFSVIERGGVQAIMLPYIGGAMSMVVFLPHSPKGLPKFEDGLTDLELARWLNALSVAPQRDTILTFPALRAQNRTVRTPRQSGHCGVAC